MQVQTEEMISVTEELGDLHIRAVARERLVSFNPATAMTISHQKMLAPFAADQL